MKSSPKHSNLYYSIFYLILNSWKHSKQMILKFRNLFYTQWINIRDKGSPKTRYSFFVCLSTIKWYQPSNLINHQMVLTPVYESRSDKLNFHQDKFEGNPELVCSYYVGSTQMLHIKSYDNSFFTKLECKQGIIRIFQPLMNVLFYHAKFIQLINKPHFCLTLRTSKVINRLRRGRVLR